MRIDDLTIGDIGFNYQPAFRLNRAVATVAAWRQRAQEREELSRFGLELQKDLGITDADVWRERRKWFWQE